MAEQNTEGLRPISRALLSVSDKAGLVEFARLLRRFNVEILSTGGTAKALREAEIEVRDVAEVTGFPEMMDGRIKTLHPRIHGALLAVRDNAEHMSAAEAQGIELIDLVVINLYPFEQTIARGAGVTLAEAVEQIDIGGPAMIRSSAKNFRDVAVVVNPQLYAELSDELERTGGALSLATRASLARQAFQRTAMYDAVITAYLSAQSSQSGDNQTGAHFVQESGAAGTGGFGAVVGGSASDPRQDFFDRLGQMPDEARWTMHKALDLRYGENPHQRAALYDTGERGGVAHAEVLGGKEMSFNNYVDADAAWQLVCDFEEMACAVIKHMNPAGVGTGASPAEAYRRAHSTDPVSAFGGVVAFNRTVDEAAARALTEIFTEVVVAPDFEESALEVLKAKKNLRILRAGEAREATGPDFKRITGGLLAQTRDAHRLTRADLKVVSKRQPTEEEIEALLFAWTVCKHTKSNAIIYARAGQTVGVGAGQMSRVDSVRIGAARAQLPVEGSVLASDAFFPFRDGIDEAAKHGITALIQPGGSVRDEETIAAADEHGLAMVFTGIRHFRH
ncbi:MAG TPA: bifunctional phosphoribosylaminoimidazolecarboxamide formyltransferase/IMP cyclohydrolase [Pyrinomonadaceae bacterium]|nr:bifunctional phosphoribosylaminoimidazolecarboxamide formyltransferase/IMP cyclohydrolase [Pyrinomonadaceae bacterium]